MESEEDDITPSVAPDGRSDDGKAREITAQTEYYFGDMNLPRDIFLRGQVESNAEGWVPLSVMLKFNRLLKISVDPAEISAALRKYSTLMEVSTTGDEIRRRPDHPVPEITPEFWKAVKARTVIVSGFHINTTIDSLIGFMRSQSAEVENVFMRKTASGVLLDGKVVVVSDAKYLFKGSIFVTFRNEESAKKFVATSTGFTFEGKELEAQLQNDFYAARKAKVSSENRRKRRSETRRLRLKKWRLRKKDPAYYYQLAGYGNEEEGGEMDEEDGDVEEVEFEVEQENQQAELSAAAASANSATHPTNEEDDSATEWTIVEATSMTEIRPIDETLVADTTAVATTAVDQSTPTQATINDGHHYRLCRRHTPPTANINQPHPSTSNVSTTMPNANGEVSTASTIPDTSPTVLLTVGELQRFHLADILELFYRHGEVVNLRTEGVLCSMKVRLRASEKEAAKLCVLKAHELGARIVELATTTSVPNNNTKTTTSSPAPPSAALTAPSAQVQDSALNSLEISAQNLQLVSSNSLAENHNEAGNNTHRRRKRQCYSHNRADSATSSANIDITDSGTSGTVSANTAAAHEAIDEVAYVNVNDLNPATVKKSRRIIFTYQ